MRTPYGLYLLILMTPSFGGPVQVTTHHNDFNRTGANLDETILNTSNVNVNTFGKLFSRSVDGQIYAQPLYVQNLTIPGQGLHNVIFVCTEHNSVYAFDADSPTASTPLWQINLGPSLPASVINSHVNIVGEIGITGTPIIDSQSNTLYVVAETFENSIEIFRLHAVDITSGAEKFNGPMIIQGSVPGTGVGSSGGILTFNARMHWQRPGLLLSNGNVYIGFGSHQDAEPYHGWLFGYNGTTLQQVAIRCLSPNAWGAGLWSAGVGLTADVNGFIYMHTGNGQMDVNTGGPDYGDSVVKLDTANGLSVVDYFSPSNQAALAAADADFGSSAPLLIPGTSLGVGGGKDGKLFLWDTANLSHFHSPDQVIQEWQATHSLLGTGGGGIFAGNVFYNSTLYVWGRRDALKAFAFNGSTFNTTPVSQTPFIIRNGYSNEPAMSLSANGTTPGTGILWASYALFGGASGGAFTGILHAFDAADVSRELWNSEQNSTRDSSGSWAKWCPPTIANGKVYSATFDNVLNVYGLLGGQSLIAATGGTPQSTTVNTVFVTPLQATVKDANNNPVSGTTVTFTAPGSGPGGAFSGSPTAMVVTNSSGVASAPTFTANGQAGTYAVVASASGLAAPASFSLTNNGGPAASIAATGGTPQSTTVSTVFVTPLQATVKDANNNPLGGTTVTFTAPGSGPGGAFSGSPTAMVATNSSGIASAPTFTANGQAGTYTVVAGVSGLAGQASFSLTNNVVSTSGLLTGSANSTTAPANLTAEGSADWVHWGEASLNRKAGVTSQLTSYTVAGSGSARTYNNDPRPLNWTDGTPTASSTNNPNGIYIAGLQNGFSFTAPADATSRTLTVHVGGWRTGGTLTAHLSDGSAADFVDTTPPVNGLYDRNYTLTYKAGIAGQILTVTWTTSSGSGNVSLQGAALAQP